MHYVKSLLFNFFIVFLSLNVFAGVELADATKLPHVGKDIFFAAGLGFLNSLIYPILRMIDSRMMGFRIILIAFLLNFAAYALLKILPLGVSITSLKGYAIVAAFASIGSIFTNYFEMKIGCKKVHLVCTESESCHDQIHTHDEQK